MMPSAVDHLKKVSLEVRYNGRTVPFDFIFGIASDGMCPFEYELLHKAVGDRLHLTVPQAEAPRTFAHLLLPLHKALSLFKPPETYAFAIVISSVTDADPREIVRAMAHTTESDGCGGDCGCGCGGH
jgi:hypothetical protein